MEQIHYGGPRLTCVDCHLGNPNATTKEAAHVTVDISFNPSTPGERFVDNPSMKELDELPPDVIRFLNPADYRIATETCGSFVLGGGNCHRTITESSLILNRATLAGTFAGGGFLAGLQDRGARFGVSEITDPYTPETLPDGVVAGLEVLPSLAPDGPSEMARAFFPVFEQQCIECHLRQDGRHEPGQYYSSGCAACHMVTSNDARASTDDATQNRDELGHVDRHRFTNLIPDSQCAHCHVSHLGRSMLAQGVRERSEPEGDEQIDRPNRGIEDPIDHVPWGKENYVKHEGLSRLYGKPYPHFIEDEDGKNKVDETPPDIHTEKGLGCIDCHNIREAHGDKRMAERMDMELDVRCQSCHGRPGEKGALASLDGVAFARSGTASGVTGVNPGVFKTDADGFVEQLGRFSKRFHPVTQITRKTDPAEEQYNARTRMGCQLHAGKAAVRLAVKREVNALAETDPTAVAEAYPGLPEGFVFTEAPETETDGRLECFACHNAWTINCYGCHMVRDDRQSYESRLDGKVKKGLVTSYGLSVVSDSLALGFNSRGRISPMIGVAIFFTHFDEDGERLIDAMPVVAGNGMEGEGNLHNPVHHHTVQREPRDCDGCHPSTTGSHDQNRLLRATGLGTGEFVFVDGAGKSHRMDRLVAADYDGDGTPDDPVELGLPESIASAEPVAGTAHMTMMSNPEQPQAGPLDTATINRVLLNRVVPQRPIDAAPEPDPMEPTP